MKELSIEEKAKRYDEALGKARRYYDEYKTRDNILYVEDMEDMFPELKESEDEKIRKALIEAIRHNYVLTGSINHIPTKDILAWLEKHEEDTYDYKRVDLDKFDERIQEFSDMLEDKPKPYWDGWYEAMEWIRTHGNPFKKQGEQKPAEPILSKEVDSQIWQIANNAGITYDQSISLLMATKKAYDKGKEDAIKEQKHWKPSEEQIQALEAIIGCVHDNASWEIGTEWFGVLFKLKEQLKKLKG